MTIILVGDGAEILAYAKLLQESNRKYKLFLTSAVGAGDFQNFRQLKQQTDFILINSQKALKRQILKIPDIEYVFCFGLRWIIKKEILLITPNWYNFNPIPIPHYLGGAHVSWQILHDYRQAAVVVQRIEDKVDRGQVIFARKFKYPNRCRLPMDFLEENIRRFDKYKWQIYQILDQRPHKAIKINWNNRIYLPRLYTPVHSWIDWDQKGIEIERWIRAFSHPYSGARSNIQRQRVYFYNARFTPKKQSHTFTRGLVVRINRTKGSLVVGAKDGFLEVEISQEIAEKIKVGQRIHTPAYKLRRAKKFEANSMFFEKNWRFFLRNIRKKFLLIFYFIFDVMRFFGPNKKRFD